VCVCVCVDWHYSQYSNLSCLECGARKVFKA
jgi:hypothetical protein